MNDLDLSQRLLLCQSQRQMLMENLIDGAAKFANDNYTRAEFVLARYRDREDYEPWFELCLPNGLSLRVSVEVRSI